MEGMCCDAGLCLAVAGQQQTREQSGRARGRCVQPPQRGNGVHTPRRVTWARALYMSAALGLG